MLWVRNRWALKCFSVTVWPTWKAWHFPADTVAVKMRGRGHRAWECMYALACDDLSLHSPFQHWPAVWLEASDSLSVSVFSSVEGKWWDLRSAYTYGVARSHYRHSDRRYQMHSCSLVAPTKRWTTHEFVKNCARPWECKTQCVPLKTPQPNGANQKKKNDKKGECHLKHMYPGSYGRLSRVSGKVCDRRWHLSHTGHIWTNWGRKSIPVLKWPVGLIMYNS